MPYFASPKGLIDGTENCPYCNGRKAVPGVTSLLALYTDMVKKEWKKISNVLLGNPDEILPNCNSRSFFWLCPRCGAC